MQNSKFKMQNISALLLLLFGLFLCLRSIFAIIGFVYEVTEEPPERIAYTVGYGDTIWSIATEKCSDMRTDKAVYLIREWNGCGDCIIHAGDVLMIPKGGE